MNLKSNFTGLALSLSFSLVLSVYRLYLTETITYLFLVWNLLLAGLPYLFSEVLLRLPNSNVGKFFFMGVCLLFLPNAPYILTDLFHLNYHNNSDLLWYDTLMIASFAWNGLLLFFASLQNLGDFLKQSYGLKRVWPLKAGFIFLSSFGIYIGRYLRFNSWDILTRPNFLLSEVGSRFLSPMDHPLTWGVTLSYGAFLCFAYFSVTYLVRPPYRD